MVLQHKCPNCGADMVFDPDSGMLSCESCGSKENIANMPKIDPDDIDEVNGDFQDFETSSDFQTFQDEDARQYCCPNCGAVIISQEETLSTVCTFCGAGMILGDRLGGDLAPAKIIPFTITKQQAQNAFKRWAKNGVLTPSGFANADRIKNITGIYVPFWLYDLDGRGEAGATCTKVLNYRQGDYDITETKYYDVYRKVQLNYVKVPVDASVKMDDEMMDRLEPYDYKNLKDFNTPYLSGYQAEKNDYTDKELFPRVKKRAVSFVGDYINGSISGYSSTDFLYKNIDVQQRHAEYTLLPVWLVCYDYKNGEHNFMMNGQTGKVVGKPPLSINKILKWFLGLSFVFLTIFKIVVYIIGGVIL